MPVQALPSRHCPELSSFSSVIKTQTCNACNETLPLEEFHRCKHRPTGRDTICKKCRLQQGAVRRAEEKKTCQDVAKNALYFITYPCVIEQIKIGFSSNFIERIKHFLNATPSDLLLVAYYACESVEEELDLHRRFSEHRTNGEWFKAAPPILRYLSSIDTQQQNLAAQVKTTLRTYQQQRVIALPVESYIEQVPFF